MTGEFALEKIPQQGEKVLGEHPKEKDGYMPYNCVPLSVTTI